MSFIGRINETSQKKESRVVAGLDLKVCDYKELVGKVVNILDLIQDEICAIKVNFHLLLPLSFFELKSITDRAHNYGLQVIADIKLNDISSTNLVATNILWNLGFDALIANPFVGFEEGLGPCIIDAHSKGKGLILLTYMSHKGAVEGYGLDVLQSGRVLKMYDLFVQRALEWKADGVVVGATNPQIISHVKQKVRSIPIFSPGLIAQGGDPKEVVKAGADYLIIARGIVESDDPRTAARRLKSITW
ncbi:MAG: orotidine 5'-phosphate decarboxylase [Nitrososphaeria archaeon]